MSDEAVPSRSYVVKQGGFTDPIVDAVMNLGRATGKDNDAATKKKTRKVKPPEAAGLTNPITATQAPTTGYSPPNLPNPSQHSLVSATRMPGSFPSTNTIPVPVGTLKTVPNPFTTSAMTKPSPLYLPKAPEFSHRASSKSTLPLASLQPSSGANEVLVSSPEAPGRSGKGGINLVLPSSFPKPPPIAMPQMQQPPKFTPIPEPAWESQRGRSEAEKFKEMVLLGGGASGPGGLIGADEPIPVIEKKRRKKKRRAELAPVVEAVNPDQPGSELTARPRGAGETGTITGVAAAAPIAEEEDDEALLQRQRQETRRRRRRTMRSSVQVEEAGAGGVTGRRLTRGASMRRRNVWDDVPEFANLDSPTIPEGDEANGEPNETQEDRDAQQALHEPPPPPFPYPTPSTGRLPPAFGTIVLEGAEGRRSPPPSFEVAMRGYTEPAPAGTHEGGDAAQDAPTVEADDEDENVPSPPSTVSTVRRARIRAETPRERRIREDRERWQRAREEGKDLDHLIRLEKERIERMQHWDRKEEGKAHSISEPQIEEPIRARASDNALRFSREQKGKGRAVYYYDASEQVEDDTVDAPVRSRASSMSTNMARSTIDEEEPDGVELGAVLPTRGNSQEADLDQNGEGSKMSGFVAQELAMAGINVEDLVGPEDGARQGPEPAEDQEVQVPGLVQGGETVRSHSPTTPIMHTHALSTVSTSTVQPLEKDKIADPSLSPIAHGSRFLEGISEGPDGQLEVVSGTIEPETSADISKVEPEVSPVAPPVPEKDEPVGDKAAPVTITRKPSLPPLFSRKRSGRKISNPWMLFRQTSTSNRAKAEPEHPTDQATSPGAISPAVESPEVSSPKESGLAKSPFFRAAGQFLKPNLGLESKNVEPKKETTDSTSPLPVAESVIPTRPRQVSTSTVNPPAVSGQPHVAYKHPFNRAVKPAWMQQAAPIWQDPKAYVMDEDRPADSTAETEVKAIPRVQVVNEPVVDDWEIVSSPKKAEHDGTAAPLSPLPNINGQRKASPAIPPRRPEAPGFPPPRLATSKAQDATSPSSESSAGESDTSDDSDSETSSDAWSVSDAVARPPAAYRLLPPRGIPANVLRAANEPPPLPRRARENRPKPMGPRQRVPPPPLPPRTRPSAVTPKPKEEANHADVSTSLSTQAPPVIATPAAVVPKSGTVEPSQPAVSTPVTDNAAKGQATESAVPKKRIIPQVDTPLTMSQPTTPGIISSTRPTAGDRTPSAISGFFNKNGNNEDDRGRSRSYSAGLRPLTIANNDSSKVDSAPKVSPLPQAVPVVFPQSKPLRLAAAPIGGQSRPKATHHATSPAERRSKPAAARLAIKPRYDDRPEQELKSQLSNRINKWRLAAIRPDAPETWEPTEEDDIPPIDRRNPANGFTRSKSMPNFVPDTVEEAIPAAAAESPVGGPEASQPSLSPASPQPTGHENGGTRQIRQRTVSSKTQRSSQPREVDSTAAVPTPQPIAAPVPTARAANQSLEYTDLDLAAAQLQGTAREYEGMNAITSFVGEEIPRGASPDSLSNLMLGPVEVESRRTTKEGKTKLKLTALGIRVHKCSICLSQFKAGDIMAMMPKCSHLGHQRCVVNWLTKDARCMVCREPL